MRGYRNGLTAAARGNPLFAAGVVAVVGVVLLLLTIVQLQAVIPFIAESTLSALTQQQVLDVGRASLTGLAAAAWGVAMLLETVGVQSQGVAAVAASRGIGPVNLSLGRVVPHLVAASMVGLLLVGPASFAGIYRSLRVAGTLPGFAAASLALLVMLCVVAVAAMSALTVPSLVAVVLRQPRQAPGLRGLAAAVSGALLIVGVALVLAGRTGGLYVLAPPLLASSGLPRSGVEALIVCVASVAWCLLCLLLDSVRPHGAIASPGIGWRLRWMRLAGTVATLELRQMYRDPTQASSTAVSLAGAVVAAVAYRGGLLTEASAGLLLAALIGVTSVSSCLGAFRASTLGWIYSTRPQAYARWYGGAVPGLVIAVVSTAVLCRLATTLPVDAGREFFFFAVAVVGSVAGLTSGVVINRPGTSSESKSGLFGSGFLAIAVLCVTLWPTFTYALFDSAMVAGAYLLLMAVVLGAAGYAVVIRRDALLRRAHAAA